MISVESKEFSYDVLTKKPEPTEEKLVIEMAKNLVDGRLGPILESNKGGTDPSPEIRHGHNTFIQKTDFWSKAGFPNINVTGGSADNKLKAELTALGEAIERYSMAIHKPENFEFDRFENVQNAISPLKTNLFDQEQLEERNITLQEIEDSEYYWKQAICLNSGKNYKLPAQLFYVPFEPENKVRSPNSSGAASGINYYNAAFRGICELMERESFMIGYLNKLKYPEVDLQSSQDDWIGKVREKMKGDRRELHVLDSSLDHPIKTSIAILIDREEEPAVSVGLGAGGEMLESIKGAILESFQIYEWMRENVAGKRFNDNPREIETLEDRGMYWTKHEKIEELSFWIQNKSKTSIEEEEEEINLNDFIEFFQKNDFNAYIADITSEDVESVGFKVVSAFVPEFYPMYLVEKFRYKGNRRLYELPVKCGYQNSPTKKSELNDIPHPML